MFVYMQFSIHTFNSLVLVQYRWSLHIVVMQRDRVLMRTASVCRHICVRKNDVVDELKPTTSFEIFIHQTALFITIANPKFGAFSILRNKYWNTVYLLDIKIWLNSFTRLKFRNEHAIPMPCDSFYVSTNITVYYNDICN